MADLNYQRMILGYHGCDADVAAMALSGEDSQRAYDWAKDEAKRAPDKIHSPSVLGSYINLGQCFDLLDTANTRLLEQMFPRSR